MTTSDRTTKMDLENTEPTAECPYGIFADLDNPRGGGLRPSCCSPVPSARAARPGRAVCTGHQHVVRQQRAGQDFALTGSNFAVVADGHGRGHSLTSGRGRVIDALRRPAAFWEEVAAAPDPVAHVQRYLRGTIPGDTINDGSTLTIVRPLRNEPTVEAMLIGDSPVFAFRHDGSLLFHNAGQQLADLSFQRAAEKRGITVLAPAPFFKIKTPDTFTEARLPYLQLDDIPGTGRKEKLAMYSALGHWAADGSCPLDQSPIVRRVPLAPTDGGPTKFVLMSDGAADMLCSEDLGFIGSPATKATDIADLVEARLAQSWRYQPPGASEPGERVHTLPAAGHDDLSVAVWYAEYAPL